MGVVLKRRSSPPPPISHSSSSYSIESSSASPDNSWNDNEEDEEDDQVTTLPLKNPPHETDTSSSKHLYRSYSSQSNQIQAKPAGMTTRSLDDDLSYQQDLNSSTASPKAGRGGVPRNYYYYQQVSHNRGSPTNSVSSEPCLPHYSSQLQPNRYTKPTLVFTTTKRKNPFYIMVLAVVGIGLIFYSQSHATLHSALNQVSELQEENRHVVSHQFRLVEQDLRRLHEQMLDLSFNNNNNNNNNADDEDSSTKEHPKASGTSFGANDAELNLLHTKLQEGSIQISALQKHLQWVSQQDALQKYGPGKIRVQLELEFPRGQQKIRHLKEDISKREKDDEMNNHDNVIVMEMAPLQKMPHSVFLFLEMVQLGLYDGCSFILNAMHVIKAAPLPYDGSSAAATMRKFASKGFETGVAFKEYTPDFPHAAYTVGFAADDSPSFYINTQDNSDIHIGEPCFAKIVSGFDVVKRMEEAPTRNGIWYRKRIGIKRAAIL